jgi:hypothetical protein
MNLQENVKTLSGNMSSPSTKKFKSVPSASKVMLPLFWDFNGLILKHYRVVDMANSARYCAMLVQELNSAIRSKRTGILGNGFVLHHDSARPHVTAVTIEAIRKQIRASPPVQHTVQI